MSEALDLLPDGRVRLSLEDSVITLRRPNLGELRKLRGRIDELVVEARAAREAGADRDQSAELLTWAVEAFAMLGDGQLPSNDELPPWFESPELSVKLIGHWRTVPWGPGVP